MNSFERPPSLDLSRILSGAQFFISGQKGSGKTALLWYVKNRLALDGGRTRMALFKSDLTEIERQKIVNWTDTILFSDQDKISVEYDFKQNWIWYILREIAILIQEDDVLEGLDVFSDIKRITGAENTLSQSLFSGISFNKIKTSIQFMLKTGPFKSSVRSDFEIAKSDSKSDIFEVINACERAFSRVKIRKQKRICILFDELELFVRDNDQRRRDLHLIRDLLYAVARINRSIGGDNPITVYASVRSEVLEEINRLGPETKRDVEDFGAKVSWNTKVNDNNHPLLKIISSKINNSELEQGIEKTPDVWNSYFTGNFYGHKSIERYLLDVSMLKPRNIIRLLKLSQSAALNSKSITNDSLKEVETDFSNGVWTEIEEELLSGYKPDEVSSIKGLLSGMNAKFSFRDICQRSEKLKIKFLKSDGEVKNLILALYRAGAIGNFYRNSQGYNRDRWIFRNFPEPILHEQFSVHVSLRKSLQSA